MITPLHITNKAGTVRIRITGYLGEDVTEQSVTQALDALPEAEHIEVYINSGGGSVPVGNAIAVALAQHPAHKTAYVVGTCASMATLIALSCDRIVMDSLAEWMVHLPITTASGRSDQLHDAAVISQELEDAFISRYSARTGMAPEQMRELLQAEKWLSAQRAQELGFVDEVLSLQMAAFYPPKEATQTPPAASQQPLRPSTLLRQTADQRNQWSYLDWARNDSAGLSRMKAAEPERFHALLQRLSDSL